MKNENKKLILFGAGKNGIDALKIFGKQRVAFLCDNCVDLQGKFIEEVEVISFDKMAQLYKEGYTILVTPDNNVSLFRQLLNSNIENYLVFHNVKENYWITCENLERKNAKNNEILMQICKKWENVLITDIEDFTACSKEIMQLSNDNKLKLFRTGYKNESYFYGNAKAIMDYAGITFEEIKYFPVVAHTNIFPLYSNHFQHKQATIVFGSYYKNLIHQEFPYVPVFDIGPYIHYAKRLYKKNDKTTCGKLLLFAPHTDGSNTNEMLVDKRKFIDDVIDKYKRKFNKISLCVYWADMEDYICQYAKKRDIEIVTAGFRFDSMFIHRLKTLIEECDAIISAEISTSVVYAIALNKPVYRLDIDVSNSLYQDNMLMTLEHKEFYLKYKTIGNSESDISKDLKEWLNDYVGFEQVRKPEYIRKIHAISKDIWLKCKGDLYEYPIAVIQVYRDYEKNGDYEKMMILKEATGNYLNY